jgi:hypothetical protein
MLELARAGGVMLAKGGRVNIKIFSMSAAEASNCRIFEGIKKP